MRLNIRLMGLLHGILIIGMIGYFLLRVSFYSGAGRSRSREGNSGVPILVLAAGLTVIGFAGTFFGNLIKAAVSRQREFLADASAVQFTRQPDGLSGALRKIGGFAAGSAVQNPNAPEASHMFFGRATSGLSAMFSTHPPLPERIRRIDPSWNGEFPDAVSRVEADPGSRVAAAGASGFAGDDGGTAAGRPSAVDLGGAVASVGQPNEAHLRYAAGLIASLPARLVEAAREAYGARAVVYSILLDRDPATRQRQLTHLESAADPGVFRETLALSPHVERLNTRLRLPLLEITLPALRGLTADQHATFSQNVVALVEADERIELFEWAMYRILRRDLDAHAGRTGAQRVGHASVKAVADAAEMLLSVLAYVGHRSTDAALHAFEEASRALGVDAIRLRRQEDCSLEALDRALVRLDEAAPQVKRRVLEAAVACIRADLHVTVTEAELLRAISASMRCPMPPIALDESPPPPGV
jgi:hypothetical protein